MNPGQFFKSIKNQYMIFRTAAFTTFKEWSAYRAVMMISIFTGPVAFFVQYFIWNAVYTGRAAINGMSLSQMLNYYGITTLLSFFIYDSANQDLAQMIQSGQFITFMLRPFSYFQYALAQKIGHRLFSVIVELLPIYLIFLFGFKLNLHPAYPGWAVLSLALSFLISLYVNFCIGVVGFWTTKSDGLSRAISVIRELCAGSIIPLVFLPVSIQKLLFILPFQFITYVPIRVFIGSYQLAGISVPIPVIVGIQALVLVAMHLIYKILWHLGIKRFTGVGA